MTTSVACTSCGQPVLLAPNSRILTAGPTPLGIYNPTTGEPLTSADIQTRVRTTGRAGHSNHTCPTPQQGGLFDNSQENI